MKKDKLLNINTLQEELEIYAEYTAKTIKTVLLSRVIVLMTIISIVFIISNTLTYFFIINSVTQNTCRCSNTTNVNVYIITINNRSITQKDQKWQIQ